MSRPHNKVAAAGGFYAAALGSVSKGLKRLVPIRWELWEEWE